MFVVKSLRGLLSNRTSANSLRFSKDLFLSSDVVRSATTLQNVVDKWSTKFKEEQIPEIDSSLNNILAHVLDLKCLNDVAKNPQLILSDSQAEKVEEMCECRLSRMPVQYIIGEWDFRDLTLKMVPPVFIPRPETEELVELVLQQIDLKNQFKFLEIGCGSGAISLSILSSLKNATSIAIDQSQLACELTMSNATLLNLDDRIRVFKHKITDEELPDVVLSGEVDMIVSNPPYVPTQQISDFEPEIKIYEDLRALDGGEDGMKIIKQILKLASKHLKPKGLLWLEVDSSHPELISKYVSENEAFKLKYVACYKDIFQNDRFVEIVKV